MKRLFSQIYLNLIAGVIAFGILGVSAHTLWIDYLDTWQEAENSSRNVLTAIARDLGSDFELLDLSLKGAMQGLHTVGFDQLPPDFQYRLLFDRSASSAFMGSLLVLNEAGQLLADAGPVILPRDINVADRDYFTVHKDNSHIGLYISRPYQSKLRRDDFSIAISRRFSHRDGSFAGIVMGSMPLSNIEKLFNELSLGQHGAINLFRGDGILLTRHPFDAGRIDRDFGSSPHVQHLLQAKSGTFSSTSPIDGVQRIISFQRLDQFPLVLTVAVSVNETFAAWKRKAIILTLLTVVLCSAVVGLTFLFQRELRRRTTAEIKLRRLARTDDLTGLPNRRAFRENFEREWRQAIRSGSPLSLLYIDVDFFKSFNDHHGHGKGDEMLNAIARALEANLRPRDMAARHGGEEFAIVLPEADLDSARAIAETIRHAVMELEMPHGGSPDQVVTVSIGVATANPSRDSSSTAILEEADAALYQAKAAGRNRVCAPGTGNAAPDAEVMPQAAS